MTILLVDDNRAIRQTLAAGLQAYGFKVLAVPGPGEALSACRQYGGVIDLLVTNTEMPGMSGVALAKQVELLRPRTPVIFMATSMKCDPALTNATNLIQKPFTLPEILSKIGHLVGPIPETRGAQTREPAPIRST
jgi:Response regulator containing CheY-like receiver, AAA-type ATPase, and DNA-binding domains